MLPIGLAVFVEGVTGYKHAVTYGPSNITDYSPVYVQIEFSTYKSVIFRGEIIRDNGFASLLVINEEIRAQQKFFERLDVFGWKSQKSQAKSSIPHSIERRVERECFSTSW